MPSLNTIRQINSIKTNNANTIGKIHKENSDFTMEQTWDNDIQSKVAYIYDYYHDDQKEKSKYITHINTTKKKIDIKFIISSYGSIDKDQVAYHIMFKPSEKIDFNDNDDMYYYETDYRQRFDMTYPIGLYIDIPDEKGIYCKWLICDYEEGNQFTKYVVLPCDHRLQWISINKGKRYKHQMWCCTRSANSYTSGIWVDRYFSTPDDINKLLLPLNNITKSFGHILENNENQRVILSAKTDNPLTWKVSKIENTKPVGIIKATLKEVVYDPNTDYIEIDDNGNIIGMWANYYTSKIEPTIPPEDEHINENDIIPNRCELSASLYQVKNGSPKYRIIQSNYFNNKNEDISINYSDLDKDYQFIIIDSDNTEIDVSEYVEYVVDKDKNKFKVKFNNSDYIGDILIIRTMVDDILGEIKLEIV